MVSAPSSSPGVGRVIIAKAELVATRPGELWIPPMPPANSPRWGWMNVKYTTQDESTHLRFPAGTFTPTARSYVKVMAKVLKRAREVSGIYGQSVENNRLSRGPHDPRLGFTSRTGEEPTVRVDIPGHSITLPPPFPEDSPLRARLTLYWGRYHPGGRSVCKLHFPAGSELQEANRYCNALVNVLSRISEIDSITSDVLNKSGYRATSQALRVGYQRTDLVEAAGKPPRPARRAPVRRALPAGSGPESD